MKEFRVGDIVVYWEQNTYGYNLLHRGEIKMDFPADKIAYVENIKSHVEYVIPYKNIDRVVAE